MKAKKKTLSVKDLKVKTTAAVKPVVNGESFNNSQYGTFCTGGDRCCA